MAIPKNIKPLNQWDVSPHVAQQAAKKQIPLAAWRAIIDGTYEVWWQERPKDKCTHCNKPKFYFYRKQKPAAGEVDAKLVGCPTCAKFITVYLHERTHGNTPIRPDQIAAGVTEYRGAACPRCGYRARITTAHKTQAQVDAQNIHNCGTGRR